jgi:hypothetical protein
MQSDHLLLTIDAYEVYLDVASIFAALIRQLYLAIYLLVALLTRILLVAVLSPKLDCFAVSLACLLLAGLQDKEAIEHTAALAVTDCELN